MTNPLYHGKEVFLASLKAWRQHHINTKRKLPDKPGCSQTTFDTTYDILSLLPPPAERGKAGNKPARDAWDDESKRDFHLFSWSQLTRHCIIEEGVCKKIRCNAKELVPDERLYDELAQCETKEIFNQKVIYCAKNYHITKKAIRMILVAENPLGTQTEAFPAQHPTTQPTSRPTQSVPLQRSFPTEDYDELSGNVYDAPAVSDRQTVLNGIRNGTEPLPARPARHPATQPRPTLRFKTDDYYDERSGSTSDFASSSERQPGLDGFRNVSETQTRSTRHPATQPRPTHRSFPTEDYYDERSGNISDAPASDHHPGLDGIRNASPDSDTFPWSQHGATAASTDRHPPHSNASLPPLTPQMQIEALRRIDASTLRQHDFDRESMQLFGTLALRADEHQRRIHGERQQALKERQESDREHRNLFASLFDQAKATRTEYASREVGYRQTVVRTMTPHMKFQQRGSAVTPSDLHHRLGDHVDSPFRAQSNTASDAQDDEIVNDENLAPEALNASTLNAKPPAKKSAPSTGPPVVPKSAMRGTSSAARASMPSGAMNLDRRFASNFGQPPAEGNHDVLDASLDSYPPTPQSAPKDMQEFSPSCGTTTASSSRLPARQGASMDSSRLGCSEVGADRNESLVSEIQVDTSSSLVLHEDKDFFQQKFDACVQNEASPTDEMLVVLQELKDKTFEFPPAIIVQANDVASWIAASLGVESGYPSLGNRVMLLSNALIYFEKNQCFPSSREDDLTLVKAIEAMGYRTLHEISITLRNEDEACIVVATAKKLQSKQAYSLVCEALAPVENVGLVVLAGQNMSEASNIPIDEIAFHQLMNAHFSLMIHNVIMMPEQQQQVAESSTEVEFENCSWVADAGDFVEFARDSSSRLQLVFCETLLVNNDNTKSLESLTAIMEAGRFAKLCLKRGIRLKEGEEEAFKNLVTAANAKKDFGCEFSFEGVEHETMSLEELHQFVSGGSLYQEPAPSNGKSAAAAAAAAAAADSPRHFDGVHDRKMTPAELKRFIDAGSPDTELPPSLDPSLSSHQHTCTQYFGSAQDGASSTMSAKGPNERNSETMARVATMTSASRQASGFELGTMSARQQNQCNIGNGQSSVASLPRNPSLTATAQNEGSAVGQASRTIPPTAAAVSRPRRDLARRTKSPPNYKH